MTYITLIAIEPTNHLLILRVSFPAFKALTFYTSYILAKLVICICLGHIFCSSFLCITLHKINLRQVFWNILIPWSYYIGSVLSQSVFQQKKKWGTIVCTIFPGSRMTYKLIKNLDRIKTYVFPHYVLVIHHGFKY